MREMAQYISTGFIREKKCIEGAPERKLEPTVTYRLEVDKGG
jgi:hypothetical protein